MDSDGPPGTIRLAALDRVVDIRFEAAQGPYARLNPKGDVLNLWAPEDKPEIWRRMLIDWVLNLGRKELVPWLKKVGRRINLLPDRVQIRRQKTRWGSCSSRRVISLNAKLLFLPPDLVQYVMAHELCHLIQPNHSAAFWRLVAAIQPGWTEHESRLKKAGPLVPPWMDG